MASWVRSRPAHGRNGCATANRSRPMKAKQGGNHVAGSVFSRDQLGHEPGREGEPRGEEPCRSPVSPRSRPPPPELRGRRPRRPQPGHQDLAQRHRRVDQGAPDLAREQPGQDLPGQHAGDLRPRRIRTRARAARRGAARARPVSPAAARLKGRRSHLSSARSARGLRIGRCRRGTS